MRSGSLARFEGQVDAGELFDQRVGLGRIVIRQIPLRVETFPRPDPDLAVPVGLFGDDAVVTRQFQDR